MKEGLSLFFFNIQNLGRCLYNKRIKFHSYWIITLIFQKPILPFFLQALVTVQCFTSFPDTKILSLL